MDSKQSLELLEQVGRIVEMGARMTRGRFTKPGQNPSDDATRHLPRSAPARQSC